jgi:hypothetical protein
MGRDAEERTATLFAFRVAFFAPRVDFLAVRAVFATLVAISFSSSFEGV